MRDITLNEKKDADKVNRIKFQITFGLHIKQLREEKNWTQEWLAQEAQINDKYVYDIEKGKKCVSAWVLVKLAKALGAEYEKLLATND